MYGKIKDDGSLEIFKEGFIVHSGFVITNPKEAILLSLGYKPLKNKGENIVSDDSRTIEGHEDCGDYISVWFKGESKGDGGVIS